MAEAAAIASSSVAASAPPSVLPGKRRHEEEGEDDDGAEQPASSYAAAGTSPSSPSSAPSVLSSDASGSAAPSLGARLLLKVGYRGEGGLGKREQGSAAPIEDSSQLSHHGLGFHSAVKRQRHTATFSPHPVSIRIRPAWLSSPASLPPAELDAASCIAVAPQDDDLLTSPLYAPLSLQHRVQECKSMFDTVAGRLFVSARSRCNPFELLRGECFQNRAALKMAEIDAITDRLLSTLPAASSLLLFADICAGPGGFSEYLLTRCKWRAKGFGFTLRGSCDFNTAKFNSNAPPHSFRAYYGQDGSGDITSSANIRHFAAQLRAESGGEGVHVCLADGGFDVGGEENRQELRSQQLILCECLTALCVLRAGGSFLCKLFDCFLPLTAGLLWLMRGCFDSIAIVKPNQSRPANSERFLVCRGKRQQQAVEAVVSLLFAANDRINSLKTDKTAAYTNKSERRERRRQHEESKEEPVRPAGGDSEEKRPAAPLSVVSVVPDSMIADDSEFVSYLRQCNESIAERQVAALLRLRQYVEDASLPSDDQQQIRRDCLDYWDVTDAREQRKRREERAARQRRRQEEAAGDGEEKREAEEETEEQQAEDRVGYVHYDPGWGSFHFTRQPLAQRGFFTDDRLFADMREQLQSLRPLEPLPTPEEREDYRRRVHSQQTASQPLSPLCCPFASSSDPLTAPVLTVSASSSVRQLHSFADHSWCCVVLPAGGVHCFVLAAPAGAFVLDDRQRVFPFPAAVSLPPLPPDTVLEAVIFPRSLRIIDAWSLPSPPSVFPSHLTLYSHRAPLRSRLQQAQLLLDAVRADAACVQLARVLDWEDAMEAVGRGEAGELSDASLLFVREEGRRPCGARLWEAAGSSSSSQQHRQAQAGQLSWTAVVELMEAVLEERERERERREKRATDKQDKQSRSGSG